MLSTLPTILNTAALTHADPAGAAGMASRDSVEAGNGFAALMQQQTDLRLADQRLSEQRSTEQRLSGQRQTEPRAAASSTPPPAAAREPAARPTEASRLERQRADRNATAEPAAQGEPLADAQPATDAPAASGVPASQPASTRRAGADDTASAVAGSTRRRRAEAAADDHARATTTVGAANLARARSAARLVQRLGEAAGTAPVAPLPAAPQTAGAGAAGPKAADDTAAAPTDVATEATAAATIPATADPIPATTEPSTAAPDAGALQPWLQAQAMVTGWQPAPTLVAQAQAADTGADAAPAPSAVAALPDRSLRRADALTTTGLASLSKATGETPVAPRAMPGAEAEAAPINAEAEHSPDAAAQATAPMTAGLSVATDDTRVSGRTARGAAAVEIARTPADASQSLAPAHTPAARAAEAALMLAPAGPTRPTTVAGATASDPTEEGIEPTATIADPLAPASEATGAIVAATAAAALSTQAMAPALLPAAAAVAATVHGTAAAAAVTVAAQGPQLRAGGTGSSTPAVESARIGDSSGTRRTGPAGGTDVAVRHPDALDSRLAGNPSTGPLPREATAEAARPGTEAASNDRGVATGPAVDARPADPTGVLIPAPASARPDNQAASTRADALRVAEAGPAGANPSAQAPTATAVPTNTTAATGPLPAAAGPVHEARIPVPLDSPAFAPALGAQISLFARDGVQTARLQLNPAEMGPISVQIALDGSAARVDFQADLAGTREVIEASLPALAGALQDAGLTLAGGGVFQQAPGRQGQGDAPPSSASQRGTGRDMATGTAGPAQEPVMRARRGLVDLVA